MGKRKSKRRNRTRKKKVVNGADVTKEATATDAPPAPVLQERNDNDNPTTIPPTVEPSKSRSIEVLPREQPVVEYSAEDDALVVAATAPPRASQVRLVLAEGRKDLKNAKPPLAGWFFDPLRNLVLDPSMAIASIVVPGVVSAVPFIDGLAATGLKIPFAMIKAGYGLLPFRGEDDLTLVAKNDILCTSSAGTSPLPSPPGFLPGLLFAPVCMGLNTTLDVLTNPGGTTAWTVSLWQFFRYLDNSSVGKQLGDSVDKPFWGGRMLDNMKILGRIQAESADRQGKVTQIARGQIQGDINEGMRMMKFATAAYATGMAHSALDRDASEKETDSVKRAIARHTGIETDDVRLLCTSEGGNMKLLRHFVAVDRESSNVVLAIRGTLSVSGALLDMEATDVDFCTGKAHKGMAEIAQTLWDAVGDKVNELFTQLDSENGTKWGFCITGHGLGGGTATLLNLKCHLKTLVGSRAVKCFGFGCPPAFHLHYRPRDPATVTAIELAIQNCTSYIHGNDCVPFLSEASVRQLAAQLEAVDKVTKSMLWPLSRPALASGQKELPQDLLDAVQQADPRDTEDISPLTIPAKVVVWTRSNQSSGFEAFGCHPKQLADLGVLVSQDMLDDHMPKQYEDALDALGAAS